LNRASSWIFSRLFNEFCARYRRTRAAEGRGAALGGRLGWPMAFKGEQG
jgi:hypothetical protein